MKEKYYLTVKANPKGIRSNLEASIEVKGTLSEAIYKAIEKFKGFTTKSGEKVDNLAILAQKESKSGGTTIIEPPIVITHDYNFQSLEDASQNEEGVNMFKKVIDEPNYDLFKPTK